MFNNEQLEKIADLLMDLAKAQLIAGIAIPAVNSVIDFGYLLRSIGYGLFFAYCSIRILGLKRMVS